MSLSSRLSVFLNRIPVVKKLFLVYLFCVILPIVGLDSLLYGTLTEFLTKQKIERTEQALKRIALYLNETLQNCLVLMNTIDTDATLGDFLEQNYDGMDDFADAYRNTYAPILQRYLTLYAPISNIVIATDNPTLMNASYIRQLDQETLRDWQLPDFPAQKDRSQLVTYPATKQISLIRTLGYYHRRYDTTKVLKVDLFDRAFLEIIQNELLDGAVTILDQNGVSVLESTPEGERPRSPDDYPLTVSLFETLVDTPWKLTGLVPRVSLQEIAASSGIYVVTIGLLSMVLTAVLMFLVGQSMTARLHRLVSTMDASQELITRVETEDPGSDEIGDLILGYNRMALRIQGLINDDYKHRLKEQELELARKQAELLALHSQINPHMLFNTLEVLRMRSIVRRDPEIADILKSMSSLFRRQLHWTADTVTLGEELGAVEDFLKIQAVIFEERFTSEVECDGELLKLPILRTCIQPFVENACIHGIDKKSGAVSVLVKVTGKGRRLEVAVKDDGVGVDPTKLENLRAKLLLESADTQSLGMSNVFHRLKLLYGSSLKFSLSSRKGQGFTVKFSFPKELPRG